MEDSEERLRMEDPNDALACAISYLHVPQVKEALENGAKVDYMCDNTNNPLHLLCIGNCDCGREPLRPCYCDNFEEEDDVSFVELLPEVEFSECVRKFAKKERSNLCDKMASKARVYIAKLLLDAGADINEKSELGLSPLYQAIDSCFDYLAIFLLSSGADPNISIDKFIINRIKRSFKTISIAKMAAVEEHTDRRKRIYTGELYDWKSEREGPSLSILSSTPLSTLCEGRKRKLCYRLPLLYSLLDYGADPNFVDWKGDSIAHLALMYGDLDCFRKLTMSGCDTNIKNRRGEIPLDYAFNSSEFFKPNKDVIKFLTVPLLVNKVLLR